MGDFEHIGGVTTRVVKSWNTDLSRRAFGLEDYPKELLEQDIKRLVGSEAWLSEHPPEVAEIYALAVKHAEMHGKPQHERESDFDEWLREQEAKKVSNPFPYTFEAFEERCDHPRMRRLEAILKEIAGGERQRGIFMWGKPGTYKTWLQMAMMKLANQNGIQATVWPVKSMVEDVQSTYGYGPDSKTQVFNIILKNQIICLDDLGREKGTADAAQILSDFIDTLYRSQHNHTLIVATNLTREAIPKTYEPAVLSRIKGMCDGFEIPIADTRGELVAVS